MKKRTYRTITGRHLDLGGRPDVERSFLGTVQERYEGAPEWSAFGRWWAAEIKEAGLAENSVAHRICQDLEARLGIAQGKVAAPDYRDYLADLIEARYGSRYRFALRTSRTAGNVARCTRTSPRASAGRDYQSRRHGKRIYISER